MAEYTITMDDEFVTLGQLLKVLQLIATGGQAKAFLMSHVVTVDGERETRRGRKLYPAMTVAVDGTEFALERDS